MSNEKLMKAAAHELRKQALDPEGEFEFDDDGNQNEYDPADGIGDVFENDDKIWNISRDIYSPGHDSVSVNKLPPGVYNPIFTPVGWFLQREKEDFTFSFKVYGVRDDIINRVKKAWKNLNGNLGVMLTGLKGTGKTVTLQQISNWAIANEMPVIVVRNPCPLEIIIDRLDQDAAFVFDEFEKTHSEPEHQISLLSIIDGMSSSEYRRLFMFTSNDRSELNENFFDRPSRIRYTWEFGRIKDNVLNEILDDRLDEDVSHLRPDIVRFLSTRAVSSIDTLNTVISEVNIFKEPPSSFEDAINLSTVTPIAYRVFISHKGSKEIMFTDDFRPREISALSSVLTRQGAIDLNNGHQHGCFTDQFAIKLKIVNIISVDPDTLKCKGTLSTTIRETWMGQFPSIVSATRYLNRTLSEKPEGWSIPEWAKKSEQGKSLTEREVSQMHALMHSDQIYEVEETPGAYSIRFDPVYSS